MAPEWEMGMGMGMGMDYGMGMGMGASFSNSSAAMVPFAAATGITSPAYLYGLPSTDTLRIDDLLDFSNNDILPSSAATDAHLALPTEPSSAATGSSSGFQPHHHHMASFADDIYVPSEEAAELEWLSKFVDDSFSDIPSYPTTAMATPPSTAGDAHLRGEPSAVPGRGVRSKRSRAPTGSTAAAAAGWATLTQPPAPAAQSSPSSSSSSSSDFPSESKPKAAGNANGSNRGKKGGAADVGLEGGVRRCTHCASEKTPQWRTGPLGPKTLCNACGVRFKSGRLVPEYRPAASPTFVLTQHSNSHRKVMELRRQKELFLLRPDHPSASSAAASASAAVPSELLFHDYSVC